MSPSLSSLARNQSRLNKALFANWKRSSLNTGKRALCLSTFLEMSRSGINRYIDVHREPHGACDSRPTALSIIKDEELEGKLRGKVMLITGCSSGIGVGMFS